MNDYGKNTPVIYAELEKALYGTLEAALLFWKNISSKLISWGFKINPYDSCVANNTINGKKCTVIWHVDDLKISHEEYDVVTNILNKLDSVYGQEIVDGKRAQITSVRGKIHDYLCMKLDYREKGCVNINMLQYLMKVLNTVPEDMSG